MGKNKDLNKSASEALPDMGKYSFAIIVSEWNEDITYALRDACVETLKISGAKDQNIHIVNVPGAYEMPMGARLVMAREKIDAAICLGCVIKGETQHDVYINNAVANGIMQLGLTSKKPVIFGLLTPNSHQQAVDRAGGKYGNKGVEAATTAIKMVHLANVEKEGKNKIGFGA